MFCTNYITLLLEKKHFLLRIRYLLVTNFFLAFSAIYHLFQFLSENSSSFSRRWDCVLLSTSTPELESTSSGVAPSLSQKTGTPRQSASAVPIPKLSLVRLMSQRDFLVIAIISSGGSCPTKVIVPPAMLLR